ncbi:hypothetical protein E5A33_10660 [Salmonella enterica subsp. enterica serovar Montevideo]|nr:hypothetical protein E5A40_23040 [Salmonella enterica subsp. enterica serovar Montevideo]KAA6705851.1 hypothetical protein E5A31_25770 [Salmonella enterica subsp. enterica serovar Lubbock]KAA6658849.1 hypothetical protein E5A41_05325 [Salmonella enterica subsp. enterica serovar Montevideo]KAA6669304.1 hypothetical protein E5A35_22450 [Salmonella enterica subsp. enterica serovar Montevideo]KAA6686572.1 hypothetical protein E5A33_10660 [Salmonella enterica subsp. enterica serovar Montevideo]
MTTKVTKESLAEKINYLESVSKLGLSLNEEYQPGAVHAPWCNQDGEGKWSLTKSSLMNTGVNGT